MINFKNNILKPLLLKIKFEKNNKWFDQVAQIKRVTKVCKGGKKLSFRVIIIVGDKKGHVGVGIGKASELPSAIIKGINDAKKHLIFVRVTKNNTIAHLTLENFGSARVLLKPAFEGTGVIAGSSIRIILELAGIQNILAKQLGSNNILNNAHATISALKNLKTPNEVAKYRGIPLELLY